MSLYQLDDPTPVVRTLGNNSEPDDTLDPDLALWRVVAVPIWTFAGAPTKGTWPKGWLGVDNTSTVYVCTVGGTPGTWVAVGGAFYASLTGPGETNPTGSLTQTGGFTVNDGTAMGIQLITNGGGVAIEDTVNGGVSILADGGFILNSNGNGAQLTDASGSGLTIKETGNGGLLIENTGTNGITILDTGTGGVGLQSSGQVTGSTFTPLDNAITATGNAATVPVNAKQTTVTNNSAATLTLTLATAGALSRQPLIVCILDATNAPQSLAWNNTENSSVTVPTTSNGSTTLPLTVGFMFNAATTKWRCVAVA